MRETRRISVHSSQKMSNAQKSTTQYSPVRRLQRCPHHAGHNRDIMVDHDRAVRTKVAMGARHGRLDGGGGQMCWCLAREVTVTLASSHIIICTTNHFSRRKQYIFEQWTVCDDVYHCHAIPAIILSCASTVLLALALHTGVPKHPYEAWWKKFVFSQFKQRRIQLCFWRFARGHTCHCVRRMDGQQWHINGCHSV